VTYSFQDALARHQRFLVHVQSFALTLEDFSLHLALQICSQRSLLHAILLNPSLVVLMVANLSDCGQALRTDLGNSGSCLHVLGGDLFSH
jgi:hypothetical protein